jgi:thiol-disulfide isomerase/thioredoxin
MRRTIATLVLLCAAVACSKKDAAPAAAGKPVAVGDAAPSFTVRTVTGDTAHVGGGGRQPVTLVNVWATWCGPCKAEFPELQTLHNAYAPRGLRLIAISIDTESDSVVAASAKAMGRRGVMADSPVLERRTRWRRRREGPYSGPASARERVAPRPRRPATVPGPLPGRKGGGR